MALLYRKEPVYQLICSTAIQHWRLLALNLGSSLVEALSEGVTLALVFMAVEVLALPKDTTIDWTTNPLLNWWPADISIINELNANFLFIVLLALAVLLQMLQCLSRFANTVSVQYFGAECIAKVLTRIHKHVLLFSYPCASGFKVGDLVDNATQGPQAIRMAIDLCGRLIIELLLAAVYISVLVGISPWLLLAAVIMGTLIIVVQKKLFPRIRAGSKRVSEAQVGITALITEDFQGLRLLHSSGHLDEANLYLRDLIVGLRRELRKQSLKLAVIEPYSKFLPILVISVIAMTSLLLFGERSSGVLPSLVTFVLALQRLNSKFTSFADTLNRLADNSGRLNRLNQILKREGKQFRRINGIPFEELHTEICFQDVTLRYSEERVPAVRNLSFNLPKGQTLALVGPSGAGKSSVADMLCGLYAPTSGQILIDGMPLDNLALSSWQKRLGVVSQDTFLFNTTIAENIMFGMPWATEENIKEACESAQATEFIEDLPDGYSTLVGERGYRLSGGQRQRLSLARAILRNPDLLILDEATSALDTQSERLVQQAIERFERSHTVLVIAHRLSTITNADQIMVLDGGRSVQLGTHDSLLNDCDLYKAFWRQQLAASHS